MTISGEAMKVASEAVSEVERLREIRDDLLEALERLVNWHGVIYSVPVGAKDPFTEARAAIKKARGE